jgi:hypothetical protein
MSQAGQAQQQEGAITCPHCGDTVPNLMAIEAGMKLRLKQEAELTNLPDRVCEGCFGQLMSAISKGTTIKSEQRAKEQNRMLLWKNRVGLVKEAKSLLEKKNHSDAAVAYEKYIRILEIVFEQPPGGLAPEHFKPKERAQELTVVTSVFWDLLCIYDTSPAFKERQYKAAEKLAEFARFTPIFPHLMRKAESQVKSARNPDAFKKFIKLAISKRPRCFIATAAFDGYHHPAVEDLCAFRDRHLRRSRFGRLFILLYYRHSPRVAALLDAYPLLKPATRKALTHFAQSRFLRKRLSP